MIGSHLRARLKAGETLTMYNTHHVSSGLAQRMIEHGADALFLDCEHGMWSHDDIRSHAVAARAVGGAGIVRPHSHERPVMIRYLNAGADGLMVPMVNTAEETAAIVEAVRYALPGTYENRLVICMIETPEAVENLDEMLKVEGVDVFFVGPSDLSQNMGFDPGLPADAPRPKEVVEAIEDVFSRTRAAGVATGTLVREVDIAHFTGKGAQFLYIHSDPFLKSGIARMKSLIA
ncbi:HpcH/HpaI aldolase family protein [Alloyangia pacifica]|uniref:HpcH/HpaI aldolase family protein n=1 Tax=Alloyangia pacifica TaxID=311180 RepID=UPI001CFCC25F|nr:aldolase/citrate lyase family protein [Alloyangia pacifica]